MAPRDRRCNGPVFAILRDHYPTPFRELTDLDIQTKVKVSSPVTDDILRDKAPGSVTEVLDAEKTVYEPHTDSLDQGMKNYLNLLFLGP